MRRVDKQRTPGIAWAMLALATWTQTAATVLVAAPSLLIPFFGGRGLSLPMAGALAVAPTVGMVVSLVAWGGLADRYGERWVIAAGLILEAAAAAAGLTAVDDPFRLGLCLLVGGIGAASTNVASGRIVAGWFPAQRRGLAMGIRQMAQPLGVALAAVTVPTLAARSGAAGPLALAGSLAATAGIAAAFWVRNPSRSRSASEHSAARNPYAQPFLWQVHGVSALLVVPQFTLSTFGLAWATSELGWSIPAAGALIASSQLVGAFGRIGAGVWSDRRQSRVGPLRVIALWASGGMLTMTLLEPLHSPVSAVVFLVATGFSVADNGIAFTAVAEAAGQRWSGRALGVQNTAQFLAASAVGPGVGALIATGGYGAGFIVASAAALAAVPLVPRAVYRRVD